MKRFLLLTFFCALAIAATAQDIRLYVSPSGDDTAAGTPEQPVRTLGRALELAGDTTAAHIYMACGSYTESHTLELCSNLTIEGGLNDSTWTADSNGSTNLYIDAVEFVGDHSQKIGFRSDNDNNWTLQRLNVTVASATDADRASSGKGATVYVIHISGSASGNRVLDCHLVAGDGGNGIAGSNGANGSNGIDGTEGGQGRIAPADNLWDYGSLNPGIGGAAVGTGVRTGGTGGDGGCGGTDNGRGQAGNNGTAGGNGAGGAGGTGASQTSVGSSGSAGTIGANGNNGTTIISGHAFAWDLYFIPADRGNNGTDGLGGGGGGSGGDRGNADITSAAGRGGRGGNGGNGGNGGRGENGANGTTRLLALVYANDLTAENIGRPDSPESTVCTDGGDVILVAQPGFGGQTCLWFTADNDSVPVAIDTLYNAGNIQEGVFYVATYDTNRNISSYDRTPIFVSHTYREFDEVTIYDTELPYTYRNDTVFEEGSTSGMYTFHRRSIANCDSTVFLKLTIMTGDTTTTDTTATDTTSTDTTVTDTTNIMAWMHQPATLDIFPNPTNGLVTVRFTAEPNSRPMVALYDTKGRKLLSREISSDETQLDLSGWAKGLYLLRVTDGKNVSAIGKVIIQ